MNFKNPIGFSMHFEKTTKILFEYFQFGYNIVNFKNTKMLK